MAYRKGCSVSTHSRQVKNKKTGGTRAVRVKSSTRSSTGFREYR